MNEVLLESIMDGFRADPRLRRIEMPFPIQKQVQARLLIKVAGPHR